jgi:hypothetical protein
MSDFSLSDPAMSEPATPSRRARRAADAALRADIRRRDRIDRYARTPTPPTERLITRVVGAVLRHSHV